jgi:hypothetical protein
LSQLGEAFKWLIRIDDATSVERFCGRIKSEEMRKFVPITPNDRIGSGGQPGYLRFAVMTSMFGSRLICR